jgi:hypothetical protein
VRLGLVRALLLLIVTSAEAATFTVINTNNSGPGSLRDAVAQANASAGADTITFSVTGTITLTSGSMQITGPTTIQGPGASNLTIDGNANDRIFVVFPSPSATCPSPSTPTDYLVTISGLTLANGARPGDADGGAIQSWHSLALDSVVVRDSKARSGGAVAVSAQYAGQTFTVTNSQLIDNRARQLAVPTAGVVSGGAIALFESCVSSRNPPLAVNISNTLISGNRVQPYNSGGRSGAIEARQYSDIVVVDSRIVDNIVEFPTNPDPGASARAGVMNSNARSVRFERTEIAGNAAPGNSAFTLFNLAPDLQTPATASKVTFVNATVTANASTNGGSSTQVYGNVDVELFNSTYAQNVPLAGGGGSAGMFFNKDPGGRSPTLKLDSSILWNPLEGGLDIFASAAVLADGPVQVTANRSLVGKVVAYEGVADIVGTGNWLGVDPKLGPLDFYGATRRTLALTSASPAIDAGANPLSLADDQRGAGFPRVQGAAADVGAFEYPASCAGLTDVDFGSSFCANVAWLKNRAVTLGCSAGLYCPTAGVNRVGMAAFMNRLGSALTLQPAIAQQAIGSSDPDGADNFFCLTPETAAVNYPRRAYVDAVYSGVAPGSVGVLAQLVATTDWGSSTQTLGESRLSLRPNQWGSARLLGHIDVDAGKPLLVAVLMTRGGLPGAGSLADSACTVRVRIDNRNGASAPFDAVQ